MRHKTDNNQNEIICGLRAVGATVQDLSQVGNGCPDILVGFHGVNLLFEIKEKSSLTPEQVIWHNNWNGQKSIAHNFDEALKLLNQTIKKLT